MYSAQKGHAHAGDEAAGEGRGVDPGAKNSDEGSILPLHLAGGDGYSEIAGVLVKAGANPNVQRAKDVTSLHIAAENGNTGGCLKILVLV